MAKSDRETVQAALQAIGAARGLDLPLDDDGLVAIEFLSGRRVTLEVPVEGGRLYAHLGLKHLDPHDASEMRRALELNLFGFAIPDVWLALDPETTLITLCAVRSVDGLDAEVLSDFLSAILEAAETAAAFIAAKAPDAPVPADVGTTEDLQIILA